MPESVTGMANCNIAEGRQRVTPGLCMAAFDTTVSAGVGRVCFPCCCHSVGATCRWFAGNVPEEALIPAHPAASLDCPSLEDVL